MWDERSVIEAIGKVVRPCPDGLGPGDDAAVTADGTVVCTDSVTFARHRHPKVDLQHFGWMAAAVNFSDLAAMGAEPVGVTVALALPKDMRDDDIMDIMSGIDQCAEFCGSYVLGGDTKPGDGIVTVTAIGKMNGAKPMKRSGARPGDIVAVTGVVGSAAAGYLALENSIDDEDAMFSFMTPVPRVEEGRKLALSGIVTSCMDLSDGLAEAAWGICKASSVGMTIERKFLPVPANVEDIASSLGKDTDDLTLYWGGDYELLFTFPKDRIDELYALEVDFSIIGVVTEEDSPYISNDGDREVLRHGIY